ncbi:MAG: hypothetical protein QME52_12340 [Bacteroidota bacterium]|nr:hypothetical protein [Bacteroidota bacterium]
MSLKVEQRLDDFFFTESNPKIYTTGAHLVPMEIRRGKKIRLFGLWPSPMTIHISMEIHVLQMSTQTLRQTS